VPYRFRLLLALTLAATVARAQEVVLFRPGPEGGPLDEARLAEAVRIYTRDLKVEWGVDAAGRRVRLTCWYEAALQPDGQAAVTLYALDPGADAPSLLRVRGPVDDNLYRALALKVRALLTGTAELEPAPPAPLRPPAAPAPPPAPPPKLLGDVEVSYQLTLPLPTGAPVGSTRHGVGVAVTVQLGRPFELGLATSIDTRSSVEGEAGRAAATVVPVWLLARLVGRRGPISGAVGLRAGFAVVAVDGTARDGEHGAKTSGAGLFGLELLLRWHLSPHFALCALGAADLMAPALRFLLDGRPALDPGFLTVRLGLGLAVAWP
jgi:hypothetical protein